MGDFGLCISFLHFFSLFGFFMLLFVCLFLWVFVVVVVLFFLILFCQEFFSKSEDFCFVLKA